MRKLIQDPSIVAAKVKSLSRLRPSLALVLGSGFHKLTASLEVDAEIGYKALAGFPLPKVPGHAGKLIVGRLKGTPVLVLSGRAHYYEGHELSAVTFPIRVLANYGIKDVVLTNAAGAINPAFQVGDLMLLADHINWLGVNPLRGTPLRARPSPFVDLPEAYDPGLRRLFLRAGRAVGARLRAGVYLAVSGPSYETPAEIAAFARLGADAVGMSTVPEAIVARQVGIRVAGLSCLTNLAAGRGRTPISHAEVLEVMERASAQAAAVMGAFARLYAKPSS
ncbi:MAG TPA: purine-nucleoside phosphorylase [Verrucomicrobiae bacterium]|nr:purine-nucleoside phosphorylase [Verrucomicrobiae bacterium]